MISRPLRRGLERVFSLRADLDGLPTASMTLEPAGGGGCINEASFLQAGGERFFLKTNSQPPEGMFRAEALGLNALRQPSALRVPRPLAVGAPEIDDDQERDDVVFAHSDEAFLLMEYIPRGKPAPDFAERLGRGLAALHRTTAQEFGFDHDNFIGSTPQPNGWMSDWPEFFAVRRLEYQAKLARDADLADAGIIRAADRLIHRLDDLLGEPSEPPALLHGDLWSGNQQPGPEGEPVIFDPAAYFGRREADVAMTELFGRFPEAFYRAYNEEWPLAEGYADRRDLYNLYHLLNHLNLFGSSYAGQVQAILRRYA
jgi:protein-ribulosamine 3-kinase